MFNYVQLPNSLFIPTKENKESIIKALKDDRVILVLIYLSNNINRKDVVNFTLEDMIISCGYKPSTKANESNQQFKSLLADLLKLNMFKPIDLNIDDIKPKSMYKLILSVDYESGFIQLFDKEKDVILNSKVKEIDNKKLLTYYCYLKARMYKCKDGDNVSKDGGRAEVCFPSFQGIHDDIGISDKSIDKYNDALVKLNLIRIGNAGKYYHSNDPNKIIRESVNIYTLYTEQDEVWQLNLKEGIKYYKSLEKNYNKVFIGNKEYKNNDRKLNGELGSIVKKEKQGKATEKDLIRKNEILMSINQKADEIFQIKSLLDNNQDMILSDIWFEQDNFKLHEKWFDIEFKIGLIDNDSNLLVDFEYYSWVITNYEPDKHDYYCNCVAKHKNESEKPKGKGLFGVPKSPQNIKGFISKEELNKELNKNYESKETIFEVDEDIDEVWGGELMPNFIDNDEEFIEPVSYEQAINEELRENDIISRKIDDIWEYVALKLDSNTQLEESYYKEFGHIEWQKLKPTQIDAMFAKVKDYFEPKGDIFNNYLNERLKGLSTESKAITV